jgi:hypothetical protein
MSRPTLFLAVFAALCISLVLSTPSCKDGNNKDVDWWVAIKSNKDSSSSNPQVAKGIAYSYVDSNTIVGGSSMAFGANALDAKGSMLENTLEQASAAGLGVAMYNDRSA